MAIYIPNRINVGYVNREDTFTKKLAYVIYWDNFGKLRKETSWEQWRDKKIEPQAFDNVPTSGFVLNKGHTRYNWSHFGNSKTVRIRIYDPRGIEFEITAENLVAVLMHTDCSRREITGELVYAWNGTELMLLPCTSDEYTKAKKYTELQATKFSAKDLKEGATYLTKSEKKVVYLGRFDYYKWVDSKVEGIRKEHRKTKEHMFASEEELSPYSWDSDEIGNWHYKPLSPSGTLAVCATEEVPDNFATLVERWLKKSKHASPIKKYSLKPRIDGERSWNSGYTLDGDGNALYWDSCSSGWYGWSPGSRRHNHGYEVSSVFTKTQHLVGDRRHQATVELASLVTHYENGAKENE